MDNKYHVYIIVMVGFLIASVGTWANAEDPISPEKKAIEMAKKSIMFHDKQLGDVTTEEILDNISTRVSNGQIKNFNILGWEAVEVSESIYTVVLKSKHDGDNSCYLFHVEVNNNVARYIDLGKGEDRQIKTMAEYVVFVQVLSTYTAEIVSQKLKKILSACMNEEDVKYLEDVNILKWEKEE